MGLIQTGMRLTPVVLNRLAPTAARKTAVESVAATTTYQSDDQLQVAVEAGAVYQAHLHINYTSPAGSGIRVRLSLPAGATAPGWTGGFWTGSVIDLDMATGTSGIASTGSSDPMDGWGLIIVGATAGTVIVQWAQSSTNAGSTSVNPGSYLTLSRIA